MNYVHCEWSENVRVSTILGYFQHFLAKVVRHLKLCFACHFLKTPNFIKDDTWKVVFLSTSSQRNRNNHGIFFECFIYKGTKVNTILVKQSYLLRRFHLFIFQFKNICVCGVFFLSLFVFLRVKRVRGKYFNFSYLRFQIKCTSRM